MYFWSLALFLVREALSFLSFSFLNFFEERFSFLFFSFLFSFSFHKTHQLGPIIIFTTTHTKKRGRTLRPTLLCRGKRAKKDDDDEEEEEENLVLPFFANDRSF